MSISNLLKIHRGLMSSFSDNLPACYAYADILFAVFAEGFILPIQRAIFMLFPFKFFSLIVMWIFTFPLSRLSIYLVGQCSMFLRSFLFLCK